MSETKSQALLELFNNAVNAYNEILYMTSTIGSWDVKNTTKELVLRMLNMERNVYYYAEWVVRVYVVSATVAGKKPDKHKTMRLLSAAKKVERLAEKIKIAAQIETNVLDSDREQKIAENFTNELISHANAKTFQNKVHAIFRELTRLSHDLMEEATNNLATLGLIPRKRIIEQYEEKLDLVADQGKLSKSIDDDKGSEGD